MAIHDAPLSKHFSLELLTDGVYACIHQEGGAAYSNAGIIDLGDRTLLVDAFDTMTAGRDLRTAAESLFERPVDTIVLTHPHSDHWIGASVFDTRTTVLANQTTLQVCKEWGAEILEDFQHPAEWEAWIQEMQGQLQTETDDNMRLSLEKSITRTRYVMAEMADFQPRYADQTFEATVPFRGSTRAAELRSFGRGHSENDAGLLIPQDRIAFIGDIGFFDTQPFLGYCDIGGYRAQLRFFLDADFSVLVPGHGPVGDKDDIQLQLEYLDIIEALVAKVVQQGGTFEQALQISLPEPFDRWLVGGMGRFEANIRYLFAYLGGELPEEV
jgi:glyoxylase-like metal-dependent hydrolase (beta-lactamase superfamily II)